jgi:hypothetical protein
MQLLRTEAHSVLVSYTGCTSASTDYHCVVQPQQAPTAEALQALLAACHFVVACSSSNVTQI